MFADIQREAQEWRGRMFPGCTPQYHGLLGAIEEAGELLEAVWARQIPDVIDAIADITIFLYGYASAHGIIVTTSKARIKQVAIPELYLQLSKLSKLQLKYEQTQACGAEERYKNYDFINDIDKAIHNVFGILDEYCTDHGWSYESVVRQTWDKVKERKRD